MSAKVTNFRRRQAPPEHRAPLSPAVCDRLADTVFEVAEEVLVAEGQIKLAVLAAVEAGDQERAAEILRAWIENPVAVEVAAGLEGR